MLTNKDIQKLTDVFATKEDLDCFKDEIKQSFSDLQISVDAYAKKADDYFQEMVMLSRKVDRLEQWIHQLAKKVGLKLEV